MADYSNGTTPSPRPDSQRARLPSLFEVLSRRTLAPVDLFSFYIYMRDQQRSVDYLDFWLDVSQHMSLCRHYVRELRRSVLVETPDLEKSGSKRSSAILENFDYRDPGPASSLHSRDASDQRLSSYLRSDTGSRHSVKNSGESHRSHTSSRSPAGLRTGTSYLQGPTDSSSPGDGQVSDSPQHTVTRADVRSSAEKILYTFLIPGSEREIILPPTILSEITESIEQEGRDDPEVFDAAKDYVFQAMERDAFPGFLRSKALGNLVPPSLMLRLIIGLLAMFGAFWTAFILIFLDKSRYTRCWVILPFTVGVYALASHQYTLDPVLAVAGLSEYTFFSFSKIREPYVRRLLNQRALVVLAWIALIDLVLILIFVLVPGKRL